MAADESARDRRATLTISLAQKIGLGTANSINLALRKSRSIRHPKAMPDNKDQGIAIHGSGQGANVASAAI